MEGRCVFQGGISDAIRSWAKSRSEITSDNLERPLIRFLWGLTWPEWLFIEVCLRQANATTFSCWWENSSTWFFFLFFSSSFFFFFFGGREGAERKGEQMKESYLIQFDLNLFFRHSGVLGRSQVIRLCAVDYNLDRINRINRPIILWLCVRHNMSLFMMRGSLFSSHFCVIPFRSDLDWFWRLRVGEEGAKSSLDQTHQSEVFGNSLSFFLTVPCLWGLGIRKIWVKLRKLEEDLWKGKCRRNLWPRHSGVLGPGRSEDVGPWAAGRLHSAGREAIACWYI